MGTARRLRAALVGDAGARFVHLANVEVERQWADPAALTVSAGERSHS